MSEQHNPDPVRAAGREAFDRTFHKIRAEVSVDVWQRAWRMAVEWKEAQAPAAPAEATFVTGVARPRIFTRWWLRSRPIIFGESGGRWMVPGAELFVPWWALPLEGLHRLVFGPPQLLDQAPAPIPMILHCPRCGVQHIDKPEPENNWPNDPHRSHLCAACKWIWRPADVATTGVAKIETIGDNDSRNGMHAWKPERELGELYATLFGDGGHRYEWLRTRVVPSPDFENCLIPAALHQARTLWAELHRRADWHPCTATTAAVDVLTERQRQITIGWDPVHDDEQHDNGDLALAGSAYALQAGCVLNPHDGVGFVDSATLQNRPPEFWPWDASIWKPKGARADLVRAAALIIAEIERLDRRTPPEEGNQAGLARLLADSQEAAS